MKKTNSDYCVTRLVLDSHYPSRSRFWSARSRWPHIPSFAVLVFYFALTSISLQAQTSPFTGMVSFGDGFSDVGNVNFVISALSERQTQYLTGYDPNYYYNGRFSNGPVWTDQLYTSLGFGALGTMGRNDGAGNINGTNFAFAGSRSGSGVSNLIIPNLEGQVSNYSSQLANGNPALPAPATTLFTLWGGANDVIAHVNSNGTDGITPQDVANNISASIASLYAEGGRYFLIPNLPALGETPGYVNNPIKRSLANAFVDDYNSLLDSSLDILSGNLAGITIIKLDINQLFDDIESDPGLYGFTNMTETAYVRYGTEPYAPTDPPYGEVVPNAEYYFYWDSVHGTALTNALIGEAAHEAVLVVPEPATGALLLGGGLILFALGRKRRQKA